MQLKRKLLKWLVVAGSILCVQTLTFYLISVRQLKYKLLPDYFQFTHSADSAYVRNSYGPAECPSLLTIINHDLRNDSALLKEKLKVKVIVFAEPRDPRDKMFNVAYETWVTRGDWVTLSDFYQMTQVEHVVINKRHSYTREVTYQWFLFFWLKSFEFIQSDDLTTLP